jgi:hypothetical protein
LSEIAVVLFQEVGVERLGIDHRPDSLDIQVSGILVCGEWLHDFGLGHSLDQEI